MTRLLRDLLRPYKWVVFAVFLAMIVQTLMNLAAPWPLKVVLDNVVGSHHLPDWLTELVRQTAGGAGKMHIAAVAAIFTVLIAALGAGASYVANYFTES